MGAILDLNACATFRVAQAHDVPSLTKMTMKMAKETEDIDLVIDQVTTGVAAVIEDKSKGTFFVLQVGEEVVAMLLITYEWSEWRNSNIWWIQSVYVVEHFRRRGCFKMLYSRVKEEAEKANACGLRLYADVGNTSAHKTYEKLGMTSHYKVYEDIFNYTSA